MHICASKLTIIGSDNGLSPDWHQAIIWTNAGILLIRPLGTNFSEILVKIHIFSFKKMHLKMLCGKWRPFCLGLSVLRYGRVIKRIVNDPNLDIITHDDFQYLWNLTSAPLMHIYFLAFLLFLPSLVVYKFQYLFSMNELWRILWDNFQRPFIEFCIYSKLVANILRIFLCFVYICIYIFAL